jgi:flagellin
MRIRGMSENLSAQKHLARVNRASRSSVRKLSSGSQISQAADGAAGLGVSQKMRGDILSMRAAQRNIQDGISMLNVAENALGEVTDKLTRMRELAVGSASEVMQQEERMYNSNEYRDLIQDIDRVTRSAEFNGLSVTPGSNQSLEIQIGIDQQGMQNRLRVRMYAAGAMTLGVAVTGVDSTINAQKALDRIDKAIDTVNTIRASHGAAQNQLGSALKNLETWTENTVEAESRIRDTDMAMETANLTRQQVFGQAGIAMISQARSSSKSAFQLLF